MTTPPEKASGVSPSKSAETTSDASRCPVCGHLGRPHLRRGYYLKCRLCKAAFRPLRESGQQLAEYWNEDFWTRQEVEKRLKREPVFRQAFQVLRRYKPDGRSVLDIGCGIGTFLSIAREAGWATIGVDPSPIACEVAMSEYRLQLINDSFCSCMFQDRKFDAVFAAQVLHHLQDPAAFLADIDRVLAESGVLLLRTPNLIPLEGFLLLQRVLRREQEFFCGPAIYMFHPYTLTLLLRRLGYEEVSFVNSKPYLEAPQWPWRSRQSLATNLKKLALVVLKLLVYGTARLVFKLSGGNVVIGPSILVIARKS